MPLGQIRQVLEASDQTYESPRVWRQLQENGIWCRESRVARLIREAGLQATVPCRDWPRTTVSDHEIPTFENVLSRALATEGLEVMFQQRRPNVGLLYHSDRGCQFASEGQQAILTDHCMLGSMSRRRNCLDDALVENFFGTLKTERVRRRQFDTRSEAKQDHFQYIEVWYNRKTSPVIA